MPLSELEDRPRTRPTRLSLPSLFLLLLLGVSAAGTTPPPPPAPQLDILPKHFQLHPGERIHYQVRERLGNSQGRSADYTFVIADNRIVRQIDSGSDGRAEKGELFIEAVKPGGTEILVQTQTSKQRVRIEVAGPAQPPINAVPFSAVRQITAKSTLLFVGHANLDGMDSTAVAKPGIDRLIEEARKNGWPVVYFVSQEYPNWYTADRHPDYAIISEGQEHNIYVEAQRVIFTGGSFMYCTLRNAQMTLHGMVTHGARQIDFVFPTQAIWVEDIWGPGKKRNYPNPMILTTTFFARRATDAQRYDEVVIPFLNRVINEFPVANYPKDVPAPPLSELLKDWTIVVRFGNRFEKTYQSADPSKTLLIEFQGV